MEAFDKIVDVKTIDGKKSCLTYIIELIEKNTRENFIKIDEDLSIYDIGRRVPLSQLNTDLNDIKKGYIIVQNAIKTKSNNFGDKVEETFEEFKQILEINIKEMEERLNEITIIYKNVCLLYCEDPNDTPSDAFVEKIVKIWNACKKSKGIMVKEKEILKKEEIKQKKAEEKKLKGFFLFLFL